jgi:hypothetical protein
MHRPHIATGILILAAAACCAFTAIAQEPQKLLSDPSRGPLIICYEQGLQTAIDEVKQSSDTPAQYLARMALAGGPVGLSLTVRDVCDKWYREQPSIPAAGKEDNISAWGLLFATFAIAEHKDFLNTCLNYERQDGDPDVVSLCRIVAQ